MFFVILFVPETSYKRPPLHEILNIDISEKDLDVKADKEEKEIEAPTAASPSASEPKMSFASSLRVYTGVYSTSPLWKIMARPFIMFFYPAVLWGFLIYGTTLTWIVVFSVVNGVIFVAPPYNFSVSQTGLIGLSPFILSIIGEVISGPLNDWLCLQLAKKNHGVYEPEFRLVLMLVVVVLGTVGFFGFGLTVHYVTNWSGPVLTYGLANMVSDEFCVCTFRSRNDRRLCVLQLHAFSDTLWIASQNSRKRRSLQSMRGIFLLSDLPTLLMTGLRRMGQRLYSMFLVRVFWQSVR